MGGRTHWQRVTKGPDSRAAGIAIQQVVTITPHDTLIHSLDNSSGAVRQFP